MYKQIKYLFSVVFRQYNVSQNMIMKNFVFFSLQLLFLLVIRAIILFIQFW